MITRTGSRIVILGSARTLARDMKRRLYDHLLDADPAFIQMVKGLELLGQQSRSEVQFSVSTTLLPLYVPASIGITRRVMIDGRDTLAFDDFWQLTVETFAPLNMLWDREARTGRSAP